MKTKNLHSEKGIALVLAITVTLIVFLVASAVLHLTFGRFMLSSKQSDHSGAASAAEAGIRYAFARLELDTTYQDLGATGFANVVRQAGLQNRPYVLTSMPTGNPVINGQAVTPDVRTNDLLMGQLLPQRKGREVTIFIQSVPGGNPEFRIRAFTDYGSS